ncbi:hypothetical protein E4U12_007630 [Claviceps purpurea]|nr:hypothetical protein E4U12_007630 [Claviceps purpurea]
MSQHIKKCLAFEEPDWKEARRAIFSSLPPIHIQPMGEDSKSDLFLETRYNINARFQHIQAIGSIVHQERTKCKRTLGSISCQLRNGRSSQVRTSGGELCDAHALQRCSQTAEDGAGSLSHIGKACSRSRIRSKRPQSSRAFDYLWWELDRRADAADVSDRLAGIRHRSTDGGAGSACRHRNKGVGREHVADGTADALDDGAKFGDRHRDRHAG